MRAAASGQSERRIHYRRIEENTNINEESTEAATQRDIQRDIQLNKRRDIQGGMPKDYRKDQGSRVRERETERHTFSKDDCTHSWQHDNR